MGGPAQDEVDLAFAKKYALPIQDVIACQGKTYSTEQWQDWYGDKQQGQTVNSGHYNGLSHPQAVDAVAADLVAKGLGEKQTTWRLRDRSEEHTSELQSLMRSSYAVFCLKTNKYTLTHSKRTSIKLNQQQT